MIVATAGHVDHGKTSLVKALTGVDTDQLPEEKRRKLTIDLGFAYRKTISSELIGFIDVPGHKKFIRNMVAGVAGINTGLLVVAADDGIMPQTIEHTCILSLLGIKKCFVAITKIDCVEANRIFEVKEQVTQLLAEQKVGYFDIFPVNSLSGAGLRPLETELDKHAQDFKISCEDQFFRMSVDRVFTLKGAGLIVTGVIVAGKINVSDSVTISPSGSIARVRGIRVFEDERSSAHTGERCAINLVGKNTIGRSIRRGSWLMNAKLYMPTQRLDVEITVLKTETRALKHMTPIHLHIGADHLTARVAILGANSISPGKTGFVQLVLPRSVSSLYGDRFIIRDQSAQRTIAGGRVIEPFAMRRGRASPNHIAELKVMSDQTPHGILQTLSSQNECGVMIDKFSIAHNLPNNKVKKLVASLRLVTIRGQKQTTIFSVQKWDELAEHILSFLERYHKNNPHSVGASAQDIQLDIKPKTDFNLVLAALNHLLSTGCLREHGSRYRLSFFDYSPSEKHRSLLSRAMPLLSPNTGSPPSVDQIAKALHEPILNLRHALQIGVKLGQIIMLEKNRFVSEPFLSKLIKDAENLVANSDKESFTTAEFKNRTGVGRNFAVCVLEYFDRNGLTIQSNDQTRSINPRGRSAKKNN